MMRQLQNQLSLRFFTPYAKKTFGPIAAQNLLLQKTKARTPHKTLCLYLLTDGRSNDDLSGLSSTLSSIGVNITVIDTEQQAIRLGRCKSIAAQLNAIYQHIEDIPDQLDEDHQYLTTNRSLNIGASW